MTIELSLDPQTLTKKEIDFKCACRFSLELAKFLIEENKHLRNFATEGGIFDIHWAMLLEKSRGSVLKKILNSLDCILYGLAILFEYLPKNSIVRFDLPENAHKNKYCCDIQEIMPLGVLTNFSDIYIHQHILHLKNIMKECDFNRIVLKCSQFAIIEDETTATLIMSEKFDRFNVKLRNSNAK
jgi:hypothetical protein